MLRYSSIFELCRSMHDSYPTTFQAYRFKCTEARPESREQLQ